MSKKRDWFKWKLRAGTRGTIRRTSRRTGNGFEVMGACVAMLDHAYGASHWKDNPEAVFKTSIEDLAIDYTTPEARVREVLGALVATGWIQSSGDVAVVDSDEDLHLRVVRYLAFNDPQGSAADRKAAQRDREIVEQKALSFRHLLATDIEPMTLAEIADLQGSVTGGHSSSAMSLEKRREEGEKKEEKRHVVSRRKPRREQPLKRVADTDLDARIESCFGWYCNLFGKTGSSSLAMTQKRYDAIAWSLSEFTGDQIAECLRGFHSDPWRRESLGRHDIHKLLRDREQIETGIDMAVGGSNADVSSDTALLNSLGYAPQLGGAA